MKRILLVAVMISLLFSGAFSIQIVKNMMFGQSQTTAGSETNAEEMPSLAQTNEINAALHERAETQS